ncbi:MAG TPA: coenzyme F420-0:L-glutamate ligase [Nitriliruptorales bacterium]
MTRLEVVALPCDVEVVEGDDLAELVLKACEAQGVALTDGDVLCVAQKVVSKAEGAVLAAPPGDDVHTVRRQVAADQAVRVVADAPWVLVLETRHGLVCANAGVDASNLPDGWLALLPEDPDGSAHALRVALEAATGARLGVIVTDTFGRPWRLGQTDVAIGASGVAVVRDERGGADRFGHTLEVTEAAVADELAGAADLVRCKADGTPFVLVRGAGVLGDGTAADLVRDSDLDLFRVAGPRAVLAGLADGPTVRPAPVEVLEGLAATAVTHAAEAAPAPVRLRTTSEGLVLESASAGHDLEAGVLLAAARIAAHTSGWATSWQPEPARSDESGWRQHGLLRIGRPG